MGSMDGDSSGQRKFTRPGWDDPACLRRRGPDGPAELGQEGAYQDRDSQAGRPVCPRSRLNVRFVWSSLTVSTGLPCRAIWQILVQPSGRIARMHPAILVIPTYGIYTGGLPPVGRDVHG